MSYILKQLEHKYFNGGELARREIGLLFKHIDHLGMEIRELADANADLRTEVRELEDKLDEWRGHIS